MCAKSNCAWGDYCCYEEAKCDIHSDGIRSSEQSGTFLFTGEYQQWNKNVYG